MKYLCKYQWLQDKGSIYLFWKKFWSIWSLGSRHWTLKYSEKVILKSLSLIFKTSEMWISMPMWRVSERISHKVNPLFRNKSKIENLDLIFFFLNIHFSIFWCKICLLAKYLFKGQEISEADYNVLISKRMKIFF